MNKEQEGPDAAGMTAYGIELIRAYQRAGTLSKLVESVDVFSRAVKATPIGDPFRSGRLSNLGGALQELFEQTGDPAVIAEAVRAGRTAVEAAGTGHSNYARYLSNLGNALRAMFERTGDPAALTEAVQVSRAAVDVTPTEHPQRGARLSNLGNALRAEFERTGNPASLTEAVHVGRAAVDATPVGHPNHARCLTSLGNALRVLFDCNGDAEVLAEVIEAERSAVEATLVGHPDRAGHLSNLGNALRAWFERTGDVTVLAPATDAIRAAVDATPAEHPDRALYLSNLAIVLRVEFERTGDSDLLVEAVRASRYALDATPEDHPDRTIRLSNLGIALRALFARTSDDTVLGEVIDTARTAVASSTVGHLERPRFLNNLGTALQVSFERNGDPAVLAEAVQAGRAAVAASGAENPDTALYLSNLGNALQMLFERDADLATLTEAIDAGRGAVEATAGEHQEYAGRLCNLGNALYTMAEHTGDDGFRIEAAHCHELAASNTAAPAFLRLRAYCVLARLSDRAQPSRALTALDQAVDLLPHITTRSLNRADREHHLRQLSSLAGQIAATAVNAGRPERAVELLEQARGVLVADTLNARSSDLGRLREHDPHLAADFQDLRARFDALEHADVATVLLQGAVHANTGTGETDLQRSAVELGQERREAQAAWHDLLKRIRGVNGFADFLRAPKISELSHQAHDGPVILVYASRSRSDALILTGDPDTPVLVVPLVHLTESEAIDRARRVLAIHNIDGGTGAQHADTQEEILDILGWIWDTIAEPVLLALGHTGIPAGGAVWPRVWWCPIGILAFLPLHAAGHHADLTSQDPDRRANPRTVMDRAISSFTATIRGLAYARMHQPDAATDTTLVVAVPDANGVPPLAGATTEAQAVAELVRGAHLLPNPTRERVLAALPDYAVAHFACHGEDNWTDPTASRLVLYDHEIEPLTVRDISALYLKSRLAYLSACNTMLTSPALANEAVHLTGAFHLAGYQHVIGTLWPINDFISRRFAAGFYSYITQAGTTTPDITRSAQALHHGTRHLRSRYPGAPTQWAAYTHTGP